MDKSSIAEFEAAPRPEPVQTGDAAQRPIHARFSRRQWLGAALGFSSGALGLEVLSLAGTWDHRSARPVAAPPPRSPLPPGVPRITHVGHCCHLLEVAGQRWLTDPWFFDPAFGSLRHECGVSVESIGPLDGIFISHRHPDHFDARALAALDKRAQVWTPDASLLGPLRELGYRDVRLSEPWQAVARGSLTIAFTPATHDVPEHSLVLLAPDARLLFCGDTGPHNHWSEIRRRFRPSTALLPCDGTQLRWEPRLIMNATEAAHAARELGCPEVIATHADASYSDLIARYVLSRSDEDAVPELGRALSRTCASEPSQTRAAPPFERLALGETRRLFSAESTTI